MLRNSTIWPSQSNSRSMYLFRVYTERLDKIRGYIEIFRAYAARKWSIQAHFAYALTLKLTHEQCDLLRALEDLAAQERTMYELDNRKDQIMTVFKLALTNLLMWVRDQYFPPTYAHATWGRLLPFFQLSGVVTSNQLAICVQLHPFNDRQYNRDLFLLCQRVNEKRLHLPDGRLLLFSVKERARPILHQQQRLIA